MSVERSQPRDVGFLIFEGFELLDVFGPAEMFGVLKDRFRIEMIAAQAGPVRSSQGPRVVAERAFAEVAELDVVLIPGGIGTRTAVGDEELVAWIRQISTRAAYVASVCTGSALLARSGVLDGKRATSNKRAFEWVMSQGPRANWIRKARWVEDGKFWTSSGVTAGIDMSLALIERLAGADVARQVADGTEYERHTDPTRDPFSELYPFTRSS